MVSLNLTTYLFRSATVWSRSKTQAGWSHLLPACLPLLSVPLSIESFGCNILIIVMAGSSSASDVGAALEPKMVAERVRASYDGDGDDGFEMAEGVVARKWQGTSADRKDMTQLGRVQELRRNFQFLSILGFGCTLIATWEVIITTLTTSLNDGGTAGLLWGFIVVVIGFSFVYLSIAEMASMAGSTRIWR